MLLLYSHATEIFHSTKWPWVPLLNPDYSIVAYSCNRNFHSTKWPGVFVTATCQPRLAYAEFRPFNTTYIMHCKYQETLEYFHSNLKQITLDGLLSSLTWPWYCLVLNWHHSGFGSFPSENPAKVKIHPLVSLYFRNHNVFCQVKITLFPFCFFDLQSLLGFLCSPLALLVWGCCPLALLQVFLGLSCRLCCAGSPLPGCLVLAKPILSASERLLLGVLTLVALELVPRVVAPEAVPPSPYLVPSRHAFFLLAKATRLLSTALYSMFVHIVIRFGS